MSVTFEKATKRPRLPYRAGGIWTKVDRSGGTEACWPWVGAMRPDGYGVIRYNTKAMLVHRHAYEMTFGPIPEGLCVLHHCDNRPCCNPSHFFLGTKADNIADMVAKGRHSRGLRHRYATMSGKFEAREARSRGSLS